MGSVAAPENHAGAGVEAVFHGGVAGRVVDHNGRLDVATSRRGLGFETRWPTELQPLFNATKLTGKMVVDAGSVTTLLE